MAITERLESHVPKVTREINITHVNIRQSIFFLVLKLVVFETIAAAGVIIFHTILFATDTTTSVKSFGIINWIIFLILVCIKTGVTIYIVTEWMEQYYEITPQIIHHRRGMFIKHEERVTMDHLGAIKLIQGIAGRIFNFGTIKLYNWATEREFVLYQIHNPRKYMAILKKLLPEADEERHVLREHIFEDRDE